MTICPECFAATQKASYQLKNLVKIVNSKRLCKDDVHILKILFNRTDNDNNILCICRVCRVLEKIPIIKLGLVSCQHYFFGANIANLIPLRELIVARAAAGSDPKYCLPEKTLPKKFLLKVVDNKITR